MEASSEATLPVTDADSGKGGSIESVVTAVDNYSTLYCHHPTNDRDPPFEDRDSEDTSVEDVLDDTDTASLEYDDECSTFSETNSTTSCYNYTPAGRPANFCISPTRTKSNDRLTISSANVTGFRSVKPQGSLSTGEIPEYVFIVEVEWSDGRHNVVKRTYGDFFNFHCYLLDDFARLAESTSSSNGMRMNLYLPSK